MISFLGVTAADALAEMPPIERSYYEYVIRKGDQGYYSSVYPKSKVRIAYSHQGEIEQCTLISAKLNGIHPKYLRTIMRSEGGWPGASQPASNNSDDLGIVQINPRVWDEEFRKIGVNLDWSIVRDQVCPNLYVGGVILARRLRSAKSPTEGLGNYHRYITKTNSHSHISYRGKAIKHLMAIETEYLNWIKVVSSTSSYFAVNSN